ncbi:MAG: aminotransferase class IV [Nesterenkonia sp.]|uniref:aminotransferase class IV n=1 Tax=Nesterenkonia marinintestina TaxID=2979865 RepID=UPI0021BEFED0|nr:aminotransferase class IV [Nesterenkonia sp. GX14115]MDO5493090.1 aminotransferase class IV [Nesterenkonia sp.]
MAEHFREDNVAAVGVRLDAEHPDGMIFDPHQPQLRVTDLGVVRGDGIFETMHVLDGHVRKYDAHLERLRRSARMLELGIPPESAWRAAVELGLEEYRARGGVPEELMVRLTATRGVDGEPASDDPEYAGTYWALLTPAPDWAKADQAKQFSVTLLDRGFDADVAERAPWLLLGAKTLSYAINMASKRWAEAHGHDDVIFHTTDGQLLEGPNSTVLLVNRRGEGETPQVVTPVLEAGVLPGTTQGAVFAGAARAGWDLGYGPLTPQQLFDADHVFLAASVRGVVPVWRVDETEMAVDDEITEALRGFLAEDLPVSHPGE